MLTSYCLNYFMNINQLKNESDELFNIELNATNKENNAVYKLAVLMSIDTSLKEIAEYLNRISNIIEYKS